MAKVSKSWAQVEIKVPNQHEELASWCLMQISNATGCEVIPANGDSVWVKASFEQESFSVDEMQQIAQSLVEHGLGEYAPTLRSGSIEQEDWLAKWKENFKSFKVGDRITISPPWEKPDTTDSAGSNIVIVIEPAMAFGTGLHATTQFCLRAMQMARLGRRILDVGTGSGILAIAALLMQDGIEVTAIDTDPVAIEAAEKNCILNNVQGKCELVVGSTDKIVGRTFDTIFSNITCEDIISLLPSYKELLAEDGNVICAGILSEKLDLLLSSLPDHGFHADFCETQGTWNGVILGRTQQP
jgi:ribosomal protein L11 methyltransferase